MPAIWRFLHFVTTPFFFTFVAFIAIVLRVSYDTSHARLQLRISRFFAQFFSLLHVRCHRYHQCFRDYTLMSFTHDI